MNKLGKLSINEDKIIKSEELVNMRGGWDPMSLEIACKTFQGEVLGVFCMASTTNWRLECEERLPYTDYAELVGYCEGTN